MNIHRAQEILAADEKIHVELNGAPCLDRQCGHRQSVAKVHAEENPADSRVVAVQELEEVH